MLIYLCDQFQRLVFECSKGLLGKHRRNLNRNFGAGVDWFMHPDVRAFVSVLFKELTRLGRLVDDPCQRPGVLPLLHSATCGHVYSLLFHYSLMYETMFM